jgi:hypothetical protein
MWVAAALTWLISLLITLDKDTSSVQKNNDREPKQKNWLNFQGAKNTAENTLKFLPMVRVQKLLIRAL